MHDVTPLLSSLDVLTRLGKFAQCLDAAPLDLGDLLVLLGQLDLPGMLDALIPMQLPRLCLLA